MSYINQIGYHLGRRDEVPNQELGRLLSDKEDLEGIREIASYLFDKNKSIASDCLKVLYELSYHKPHLIVDYYEDFITLLNSKNNRMVWGAMIAIASIAKVEPDMVYKDHALMTEKIETGTLITHVSGVMALIHMATESEDVYDQIKDQLFKLQADCRPIDFAKRAERMMESVRADDIDEYVDILSSNLDKLSKAGQKRTEKVIKQLRNR